MVKGYSSSVYSFKSTKSAKSGKSFFSLSESSTDSLWRNIKNWIPSYSRKKKSDNDSISTSSFTSINRFKRLFNNKQISPRASFDMEVSTEDSILETSSTLNSTGPVGILINREKDSEEAIKERRERRRRKRRENMLKHYHTVDHECSSSSSDTLLTPQNEVSFQMDDPRIMFLEPSPVPRFRNVAPPPPPSPPYMNIIIDEELSNSNNNDIISIIQPFEDDSTPTILTPKSIINQTKQSSNEYSTDEHERRISLLIESLKLNQNKKKYKLYFHEPYFRGQTLRLSLENTIPEDHIILFKFLTTNTNNKVERYFVRPSAGKIVDSRETDIMIFLNQVPPQQTKDTLIIRWAAVQRNTEIETWLNNLPELTRRRWIDMLDEQWPNQVTIKLTKIKVEFV